MVTPGRVSRGQEGCSAPGTVLSVLTVQTGQSQNSPTEKVLCALWLLDVTSIPWLWLFLLYSRHAPSTLALPACLLLQTRGLSEPTG